MDNERKEKVLTLGQCLCHGYVASLHIKVKIYQEILKYKSKLMNGIVEPEQSPHAIVLPNLLIFSLIMYKFMTMKHVFYLLDLSSNFRNALETG